jgi:hypothetical protein
LHRRHDHDEHGCGSCHDHECRGRDDCGRTDDYSRDVR